MSSLISGLRRLLDRGVRPAHPHLDLHPHTPDGLRRRSKITRAGGQLLQPLEQRIALSVVPPDGHSILKFDTTYGNIFIELFDDDAPLTVANFLTWVNSDKLNGSFFHRMVKKGDPQGGIDILQGGGFTFETGGIPQDVANEDDPTLVLETTGHSNLAGTIAMARTSVPNSAQSGFFFNVTDNTVLDPTEPDNGYAVFGQVVEGMDVIQTIFALKRSDLDPDDPNARTYDNVPVTPHFEIADGAITEEDLVYLEDASVVSRSTYRAVAGSPVDGSVNTQDQLFITSLGLDGRAEVFTPSASPDPWVYQNVKALTGAPSISGNLAAFHDYKTGLRHAVGPSANGLILFTQGANGTWSFSNLTTSVAGGKIIEGEVTVFTTTDGFVYIAGMADDGHLVAFRQEGTASNWAWALHDFTSQDLEPRGLTTPAFAGRLTSFVTSWNALNIVGLDGDGEIQAVWWAPGIEGDLWTTNNLSEQVGAPAFTGGLTVYLTSWNAINIVGITQAGNVSATYWAPEFQWATVDLTAYISDLTGSAAPQLVGSTISSFVTPWGATNIAGLDANGKLWVYWWAPASGDGNWTFTDMSTTVPAGTKPMVGRITGVTSPANTINLVGTASNGDVMRYYWNPTNDLGWQADDVSYLASLT
ncbi:MAG: peptidylprolyl isomerase [Phycisphaerales bacterium]|nr:peptidylprolyl isomerase [Phycisphaerales bacterium]